jgi:hypothetical protein
MALVLLVLVINLLLALLPKTSKVGAPNGGDPTENTVLRVPLSPDLLSAAKR